MTKQLAYAIFGMRQSELPRSSGETIRMIERWVNRGMEIERKGGIK